MLRLLDSLDEAIYVGNDVSREAVNRTIWWRIAVSLDLPIQSVFFLLLFFFFFGYISVCVCATVSRDHESLPSVWFWQWRCGFPFGGLMSVCLFVFMPMMHYSYLMWPFILFLSLFLFFWWITTTTVWREFSGSLRRHGDVRWPTRCTQVGPGQLSFAPFSVGVTGLGGSSCSRRPPQQSRGGSSRSSSRGDASQRGRGRSRRCPAALTVALSQSGQSRLGPASRSQSHDLHRCQLLRPRRPQTRQRRHLRVCQSLLIHFFVVFKCKRGDPLQKSKW